MQVAGRVLGRCRGALHKQSARMLAAQDGLSKWPDFLTQVPLLWPLGCTACNHQNSDWCRRCCLYRTLIFSSCGLQLNAERAAAALEAEEGQAAAAAGAELKHKVPLGQRSWMHTTADSAHGGVVAVS
jgi:hypothetical protein